MAVEKSKPEKERKDEDAPELETPEAKPSAPPENTPRDDEAPLETPERPAARRHHPPRETRTETTVISRKEFVENLVEKAKEGSVGVKTVIQTDSQPVRHPMPKAPDAQVVAELAASGPTVQDPYVTSLFQHVAAHPVDAHAPVWGAHASNQPGANTSGGFS